MMTRLLILFRVGSSLLLCYALTGCVYTRNFLMPDTENLISGAGSIAVQKKSDKNETDTVNFELIDISQLETQYTLDPNVISADPHSAAFVYRRNELQDRLIAASNQRCGSYMRMLTSSKTLTDTSWGSIATLLSGAAAVTTPTAVAQALAAGSAVSNGLKSDYDQNYFQNLSITVISSGIARQRMAILERILKEQQNDLMIYSVNRAIADALTYHTACNIISGLEAAAAATKNATNTDLAGKPSEIVASINNVGIPVQQSLDAFQLTWNNLNQAVARANDDFAKFKKANSDNTLSLSLPSADNLTLLHKNCVATLSDFLNKDTVNSDLTAEASAWLISKSMLQIQQTYQPQFKALQSAVANPKLAITNPPVIVFDTEFGAVLNLCKQATN